MASSVPEDSSIVAVDQTTESNSTTSTGQLPSLVDKLKSLCPQNLLLCPIMLMIEMQLLCSKLCQHNVPRPNCKGHASMNPHKNQLHPLGGGGGKNFVTRKVYIWLRAVLSRYKKHNNVHNFFSSIMIKSGEGGHPPCFCIFSFQKKYS